MPFTLTAFDIKQCGCTIIWSFLRMLVNSSVIADYHSESEFHIRYWILGDDLILVTHCKSDSDCVLLASYITEERYSTQAR